MNQEPETITVETSDLAYELIGVDDVGSAVKQVLQKLGLRLQSNLVRLVQIKDQAQTVETIIDWNKNKQTSIKELPETTYNDLQPIIEQLKQANFVFSTEKTIQEFGETTTKWFKSEQLTSVLFVPVPINRVLGGFLLFYDPPLEIADDSALGLMRLSSSLGALLKHHNLRQDKTTKLQSSISKLMVETIDLGLIVLDSHYDIQYVNQAVGEIFQRKISYFHKKSFQQIGEIFPQGSISKILRHLGAKNSDQKEGTEEIQLEQNSGEVCDLEIRVESLTKNQQVVGDLIVIQDVTFRKQMEQSAQDSEAKLRRVLESVKEGITLSDNQGNFEIFNQEMVSLTGFSKEEVNQSHDLISLIHHESIQDRARSQLADFSEGEKRTTETEIRAKNGATKQVAVSTTLLTSNGKPYYLSAYHDETLQKQTEKELREARDHLEEKVAQKTQELQDKVIEAENLAKFPSEDPFPVMRIQPDGNLLYANGASQDILNLWNSKVGGHVPEGWQQLVSEVFNSNNRKIFEIEILGQFISFVLVPVKDNNYVNLYGRDISKEKEIDQMKNQFISMVSHQIRTPLTSIRWYSEMLLKGKNENSLNDKQTEITGTIHQTAVSMTDLVNDLLSISRMESGKLEYKPERSDLTQLLDGVVVELQPQLEKSHISFQVQKDTIPTFEFDTKLIREVYLNLLSNAIKYTPESGTVTITLEEKDNQVLTCVADTGIGIPEEAKEDIFKRFYRAQNAVDREFEGTGLGLSVAKMIIEKAGGKIWFESQLGQGTKFYFTLPLQHVV